MATSDICFQVHRLFTIPQDIHIHLAADGSVKGPAVGAGMMEGEEDSTWTTTEEPTTKWTETTSNPDGTWTP